MKISHCVAAAVFCFTTPAFSQECADKSQSDKIDCLYSNLGKVDKKIEENINENISIWQANAKEGIPGGEENVAAIKQSHTSWLKYREDACNAVETSYWGSMGSGAAVALVACKIELSEERLQFLSIEH